METVTITKKEYKALIGTKDGKSGRGKVKVFKFNKKADFLGMWKDRKDIKDSVDYIRKLRDREDGRSQ